ncbi:HAD family hydrolase [Zobellia alginiliquefaciens]|uniref:HAD family hydrolase n=1 Tax=Zobellia alginiliquefaciens TaxID=3032586 RepID=UPI0023E3E1CD|nr:HAD family hydrolase [Zobellia alginiliquefaciens]
MHIFFDLDDTLIDSESAHEFAIKALFKEYFKDSVPENIAETWMNITNKYLAIYFEKEIDLEQQRISRIQEFWKYFGENLNVSTSKKIYSKYHKHFLSSCLIFEDTINTLEKLSDLSIGLISNGTYPDQIFKLRHNNLHKYLDQILISEKVGFSKPDKRIFQYAAKQANKKIEECIYIGNSFKLDYLGSLNSGMKAIWLDRRNTATSDFDGNKIINLNQLIDHQLLHRDQS